MTKNIEKKSVASSKPLYVRQQDVKLLTTPCRWSVVAPNLKSDESIISIRVDNAIIRNLLYALKKHLSERYKREVSFYEIFVLTTLLYNVEKRCEWFYPYLKDSEIEKITGKTIKEWKAFLKQKG